MGRVQNSSSIARLIVRELRSGNRPHPCEGCQKKRGPLLLVSGKALCPDCRAKEPPVMGVSYSIPDDLIDAWDDVRRACERVETSLPTQLSVNVESLNVQWRRFDEVIKAAAMSRAKEASAS